jgi:alpha-beta hydrolase superfamily lysophospholipase
VRERRRLEHRHRQRLLRWLQFSDQTWDSFGGEQYAPAADQAIREQQIHIAERAAPGPIGWELGSPTCREPRRGHVGAAHLEGERSLTGGGSAYWQAWLPEGDARAVVVIVHGLGEHSGRYHHVGRRLAGAGFAAYAADHRGHGRSGGRRANIGRMAVVVGDLAGFVRFAAERCPGVRVFMLGHSPGGLIALQYATGDVPELAGLVLTGPLVQVESGSPVLERMAGVLSALAPNLGVLMVPPDAVSRDPAVVAAYRADPLVHHGKVPARTGAEILATTRALPARLPRLRIPLLLIHGTCDRLAPAAGSQLVHDGVASPDRTLRLCDGLWHEVMNEPERDEILDEIVGWISDRIG